MIVAPGAHVARNRATVARLRVADSRGFGARTAASGRYGPYACWHAYRGVLFLLFCAYPTATVRTCCATYRGLRGFEENFQITEYQNLGSVLQPRYMRSPPMGRGRIRRLFLTRGPKFGADCVGGRLSV
ncbi:hypothetical protein [Streptomyces sp. NPDC059900]|uniref:hypothetical protein n=1 Tax=Streptomyces sp. NPDC059900 TaxID=3155816 RepID=UPI003D0527B1